MGEANVRRVLAAAILATTALTRTAAFAAFDPSNPAASGYTLSFEDDFRGSTIDPRKWRTAYHWGANTTINNELDYYIDIQDPNHPGQGIDPFHLSNGILTIQAAKNTVNGHPYTSGAMATYNSFSQTYGYFEARMQMPCGQGLWPAFWLDSEDNQWPPELDVVEMVGQNPTTLINTEHDNVNGKDVSKQCWPYPVVPDMTQGFHRYGLLWTSTDLTWYFDGQPVCHIPTQPSQHKAMYMIVNLAVGSGGWTGTPTASTPFPQHLRVDYVRAYRAPGS